MRCGCFQEMLPATKRSGANSHFLCMGVVGSKLAPPLIHEKNGKTAYFIQTEEQLVAPSKQEDTGLGEERGGNTESALKNKFRAIPYFLVIANYEKAFLYVLALKQFLSDTDEQAQQIRLFNLKRTLFDLAGTTNSSWTDRPQKSG